MRTCGAAPRSHHGRLRVTRRVDASTRRRRDAATPQVLRAPLSVLCVGIAGLQFLHALAFRRRRPGRVAGLPLFPLRPHHAVAGAGCEDLPRASRRSQPLLGLGPRWIRVGNDPSTRRVDSSPRRGAATGSDRRRRDPVAAPASPRSFDTQVVADPRRVHVTEVSLILSVAWMLWTLKLTTPGAGASAGAVLGLAAALAALFVAFLVYGLLAVVLARHPRANRIAASSSPRRRVVVAAVASSPPSRRRRRRVVAAIVSAGRRRLAANNRTRVRPRVGDPVGDARTHRGPDGIRRAAANARRHGVQLPARHQAPAATPRRPRDFVRRPTAGPQVPRGLRLRLLPSADDGRRPRDAPGRNGARAAAARTHDCRKRHGPERRDRNAGPQARRRVRGHVLLQLALASDAERLPPVPPTAKSRKLLVFAY